MEYSLARIAHLLSGDYRGDGDIMLGGVASLSQAKAGDIAYIDNGFHKKYLANTKAGAVLMTSSFSSGCQTNVILVSDPLEAMLYCAHLFSNETLVEGKIADSACIGQNVILDEHVVVGDNAIIADNVTIGKGCTIGPGVVIEANVAIGNDCVIKSNAVINANCRLGDNVKLDYGCVIGATPFNPFKSRGQWQQGLALGAVIIDDDVSIGANTVIDRGSLADTLISQGAQIDNLVQIAHDVCIGVQTSIAGCAVIGAYTEIGNHCIIGGASTIAVFLKIADEVVVTGMSAVNKSLLKPGVYSSATMVNKHQVWRRNVGRFQRLDFYVKRLKKLEKKLS